MSRYALGQGPWAGLLVRIDRSGEGPPWPIEVQDEATEEWQTVGPARARALSGLLCLPPLARSGIIDGAYLATSDTLAVLTAANEPIATQPLRVVSMEEHILTSAGDAIVV